MKKDLKKISPNDLVPVCFSKVKLHVSYIENNLSLIVCIFM